MNIYPCNHLYNYNIRVQLRGIVKEYLVIIWDNFLQFSMKTYIVGTH